jgi:hypothetical protein
MNPLEQTNWLRIARALLFVGSAVLMAVALHLSIDRPWLSLTLLVAAFAALIPPYVSRRKLRKLLLSGDAERVVAEWRQTADRGPHRETTGPLIAATAFAAYGWVQEARAQLQRVRPGPGWEAAVEHRMFVETLLEAFDGDRDHAMRMADAVEALPIPSVSPRLRDQVLVLRASLAALARAFAHHPQPGDLDLLMRVARTSPLVSWAMKYAAAIVAIDRGETWRVPSLLSGAPAWPEQSAFRKFHDELLVQLLRGADPTQNRDSR